MSGGANHSRLTSMTYPDGKVLTSNYSSGLNSNISRISSLSDTSGTLESYDYLGLSTVVLRAHSQSGVDLTYIKLSGESNGDAGDQYNGLDRFDRIVLQRWVVSGTTTVRDGYAYGYDRNSNRLYRENLVDATFSELYAYDSLNQLTSFDRGTLNGGKTAISGSPTSTQSWSLDALGNFSSVTTNGTTVNRTHDKQNEVTAVGAASLAFDGNGNLTTDEQGRTLIYDAWNRVVEVKNGSTTLVTFKYDALWHMVVQNAGTAHHLYYSANWQVIEEQVSGNTVSQNVWSIVYVDALILRDRDTDSNGSLDERIWAAQDANYNVTALYSNSGTVSQRFVYTTYGVAAALTSAWASTSDGYGWTVRFQGMFFDLTVWLGIQRHRVYSPELGRWMQLDPTRYSGRDINLYRAFSNSPTARTDSTGLAPTKPGQSPSVPLVILKPPVPVPPSKYTISIPEKNPYNCTGTHLVFDIPPTVLTPPVHVEAKPQLTTEPWGKPIQSETGIPLGEDMKTPIGPAKFWFRPYAPETFPYNETNSLHKWPVGSGGQFTIEFTILPKK